MPPMTPQDLGVSQASPKSPAVARAIAILRYLGESRSPMGVNAMARDLQIVPSTCLHILRALEADGLVQSSDADHRYSLSSQMVRFARRTLAVVPGVREAEPMLQALAERHGTSVALLHIGNTGRSTVLAAAHLANSYGVVIEVGRRFPVYAGASGRCVAAHRGLSREEAKAVFAGLKWAQPLAFQAWEKQVRECAAAGSATDDGHYLRGFVTIAVPVSRDNSLWRTLVSVSARGQLTADQQATLTRALVQAGAQLSS